MSINNGLSGAHLYYIIEWIYRVIKKCYTYQVESSESLTSEWISIFKGTSKSTLWVFSFAAREYTEAMVRLLKCQGVILKDVDKIDHYWTIAKWSDATTTCVIFQGIMCKELYLYPMPGDPFCQHDLNDIRALQPLYHVGCNDSTGAKLQWRFNSSPPAQNGHRFRRRHLQMNFRKWIVSYFHSNFIEVCS